MKRTISVTDEGMAKLSGVEGNYVCLCQAADIKIQLDIYLCIFALKLKRHERNDYHGLHVSDMRHIYMKSAFIIHY